MIVTAWNNGSTGYGVKVTMQDREQFFSKCNGPLELDTILAF